MPRRAHLPLLETVPCWLVRKVIAIGGSAGGIKSLCDVLQRLPIELDAPVLVVIHTGQQSRYLAEVLKRCDHLPVTTPNTSAPLQAGRVYLAAANRHLVVKAHCAVSVIGPRENLHRPSVDVLFRSVARTYRSQVIAVVLSGAMDDGSAGALAVKVRGGTVIVEDPEGAEVSDMPANVLRQVKTDHCLPPEKIASVLVQLVSKGRPLRFKTPTAKECQGVTQNAFVEKEPPGFTCPDCGGVMMKVQDGKNAQFRCHVGHRYSFESFSDAHADALERALWVAMRKLNERAAIQEIVANQSEGRSKIRHQENADAAKEDMRLLQEILARL